MDWTKKLNEAIRGEKDLTTHNRMLAVRAVCELGQTTSDAAEIFGVTERSVRNWVNRFRDGGPEALKDLPRSGRPPSAPRDKVGRIMSTMAGMIITPKQVRQELYNRTGFLFSMGHVRRLMREHGMSSKIPRPGSRQL